MTGWLVPILQNLNMGGGAAVPPALNIGGVYKRNLWSWPRQFARVRDTWQRSVWRVLLSWKRVATWRPGVASQLDPMELVKTASENRVFGFDFSGAPEVYDGTSVIDAMASGTSSGGTGLTIGALTVIATAFDDIPVNGGLKCTISGGTAGTSDDFAVIGVTTAGRTLGIPCKMTVVADHA